MRNLFFFSCFFVFFEKFKISYFKGKTEKKNVNVTKCTREKKTKKNAFFFSSISRAKKKNVSSADLALITEGNVLEKFNQFSQN